MSKIVKTEAVVLKSINYRETSKIVTFYTKEFGKLNGIVKGARKMQSKFGASLDSMAYVLLVIYKKETGGLNLISQCDLLKSFSNIPSNLDRLVEGLKVIEIIYQISHFEEKNYPLFKLLVETFSAFNIEDKNFSSIGFAFKIKLGELLGYRYNFSKCGKCGKHNFQKSEPTGVVSFDFARGAVLCSDCQNQLIHPVKISTTNLSLLNQLETEAKLSAVSNIKISSQNKTEIGNFLLAYLRYHISEIKELKSDKIFNDMQKIRLSMKQKPTSISING